MPNLTVKEACEWGVRLETVGPDHLIFAFIHVTAPPLDFERIMSIQFARSQISEIFLSSIGVKTIS